MIRQVAAPDGGVTHLGSVDVGGKSREGWIGIKERNKKGGVMGSKASKLCQQWDIYLAKPSIFACLTPTGKSSWSSQSSMYSGWKSSVLNGNISLTIYEKVCMGALGGCFSFLHMCITLRSLLLSFIVHFIAWSVDIMQSFCSCSQ